MLKSLPVDDYQCKLRFYFGCSFSCKYPLSITTSLANILILIALRKECSLHPSSRFLFRCLAFSDLFVGLISQPVFVVYLLSLLKGRWKLACFMEAFEHVVGAALIGLSLCILMAITIDRLLALVLRLRYRTVVTVSRVRKLIVLVLVLATAVASTSLWKEKLFFGLMFVFVFLSGIISTFCYLKMFLTLRRQCRIQDEQHQQTNQGTNSTLTVRRFRKTVTSVLLVHCALILCFFPFTVNKAVNSIVKNNSYLLHVELWTITLAYCNSFLNPIIYCWRIPKIRQVVTDTLKNIFRHQVCWKTYNLIDTKAISLVRKAIGSFLIILLTLNQVLKIILPRWGIDIRVFLYLDKYKYCTKNTPLKTTYCKA